MPTSTSTLACAYGSEPEEMRFMMFNPDVGAKSWWSFFYNAKIMYLDGAVMDTSDEAALVREWKQNTGFSGAESEIFNCVFGSPTDSALQENAFYKHLSGKPAALAYLEDARKAEQLSAMPHPWGTTEEETQQADQERKSLIDGLLKKLAGIQDPFLKKKYGFQVMKLANYADDNALVNRMYSQYFIHGGDHVLDWWAMHYKSVMLERTGQPDSANYLHALVFNHATNKMKVSRQWYTSKNIEQQLLLARNDAEKADILVMREAINPWRSLESIRNIYTLQPDHANLPMLIGREINKIEDWLGTTRYVGSETVVYREENSDQSQADNWDRDRQYLDDFTEALMQMEKLGSRDLRLLWLSYLNLLRGNAQQAAATIDEIREDEPRFQFQKNMLRAMLIAQSDNLAENATQDRIGAVLADLIADRESVFESQKQLFSLMSYLRYSFEQKGLGHLAGLFAYYANEKFCQTCSMHSFEYALIAWFDKNGTPADVEKVIAVYDKPSKNKLEKFLVAPYTHSYYFYDVMATMHLRANNTTKALAALRKVPDDFWLTFDNCARNLAGDPFLNNAELFGRETMTIYNKREILEKLVSLERSAASGRTHDLLQLGNAWFNFTRNAWFMLSYEWSSGEMTNKQGLETANQNALRYYRAGLRSGPDPETRAKVLYMIALLSESRDKVQAAIAYETSTETEFYQRKSCLTTSDLANR